jgi:cytoskeletal protein CcmA (bactofilin family)
VVTVNSGLQVKNNGNVDGCGVMIVNGNFDIQGNVSFRGLIIVKGTLTVTGSALVYGSVWTEGLAMDVGGNGQVYYSSQAMQLANNVFPTGAIPAPMKISSLADCADLGSGVGGCP